MSFEKWWIINGTKERQSAYEFCKAAWQLGAEEERATKEDINLPCE